MKSRLRRKNWWRPWVGRILVAGTIGAGFWYLQHSPYPKAAARGVLSVFSGISSAWGGFTGGVGDHFGAVDENRRLRRQIEQFTWELQDYETLLAENRRLRGLLAAVPPTGFRRVTVPIIARSPDTWHRQVILGAGKAEGVTADVPAMTAQGLVGRIVQVGEHHATLQLISDPLSAVSCMDVRSGAYGMAVGQQQEMASFEYLKQNANIKKGDLLATSGLGVFPKGIPVGLVREVKRVASRINPEIAVDLMVNFDDLQEVVLALPTGERLSDAAPAR